MSTLCDPSLTRRRLLGTAGALFGWSFLPRLALAAGARDTRFVVVVLRGALDGLSAVAPLGDPAYAGLRGPIALTRDGEHSALPLDGFFAVHPAMPNFARMYHAGAACVVHAVATGYRERSHFDAQDVLESGQPGPGQIASGWLNRLAASLVAADRLPPPGAKASLLGVGAVPPLVVRGTAPVYGWAPPVIGFASDETARRVLALYGARDPELAARLQKGLEADRIAGAAAHAPGARPDPYMRTVAEGAARILAAEDGPRLAALAFEGWDTHADEGGATGRLAKLLGQLDEALAAFETGLGPRWRDTVVLVVTEFGRTAQVNGTVGTDHGTATTALLAGGAVKGGRVVADWPGLGPSALYEGRDLKPTLDLRSVVMGVAQDLYDVSPAALGRTVFPGAEALKPYRGLVA